MPLTHERYQLYLRHPDIDPAIIDRIVDDDGAMDEITARIDPYQTPEYTALEESSDEEIRRLENVIDLYTERIAKLVYYAREFSTDIPELVVWLQEERTPFDNLDL